MPQKTASSKIIVWRFTDGKAGHEKQSQALVASLKELIRIECIDIPILYPWAYYLAHWLFKLKIKPYSSYKRPDLLIGAGHRTHLALLAIQRYYHCQSIVIMSPSLPQRFFTVIVAPKHDYFHKTPSKNVVMTPTALSPYIKSKPNAEEGLILLGGKSSHYYWDDNKIAAAVEKMIISSPNNISWKLTTSRRTPKSTVDVIREICAREPKLEIAEYQNLPKDWLSNVLKTAGNIQITPDSVSMISEALMTDATVGLLELSPKKKNGKIHKANQYLAEEGFLHNRHEITSKNRKKIDIQGITKNIVSILRL